MRKMFLLFCTINIILAGSSCKIADLRTSEIKKAMEAPGSVQKARSLLQDAYIAHSAEQWERFETYEVDFQEEFFKLKFACAFPKGKAQAKIEYVPDNYDGRLTIVDGKKAGEQWGLSEWASWKKKKGKPLKWKHSRKIKFWLPTYQYFIQFPVKILEADYMRYGGEKVIQGRDCDILFVSWKTAEPQKDFDQYLVYIDKETKMINALEYTVRGFGGWVVGGCVYENYQEISGVQVPRSILVMDPKIAREEQKPLHQMQVKGMRVNVVPASELSIEKE